MSHGADESLSMTAALTPSPPRLWPTSTTWPMSSLPNQSLIDGSLFQSVSRPRW